MVTFIPVPTPNSELPLLALYIRYQKATKEDNGINTCVFSAPCSGHHHLLSLTAA